MKKYRVSHVEMDFLKWLSLILPFTSFVLSNIFIRIMSIISNLFIRSNTQSWIYESWIHFMKFAACFDQLTFFENQNRQKRTYRKVTNARLSWLAAHLRIFRLCMKGKFDAYVLCYVLWPLAKRVQKLNSRPVY